MCHKCGYDSSCDFTEHRTVSAVPRGDAAQRQFMYIYHEADRREKQNIISEPEKPQEDVPTPPTAEEQVPEHKTEGNKSIKSFIKKKPLIAILAAVVLLVIFIILITDEPDEPTLVDTCSGYNHEVELYSDGTVVATGSNFYGQCYVDNWTDIVAIAAGNRHTVGLRSDGTVVTTGYNGYGLCNVDDWTDIVAIAAYEDSTVGLCSDGTIVTAGYSVDADKAIEMLYGY